MRSLSDGVDVGPESVTSEVSPTDANELEVVLFFKFGLSSNNNRVGYNWYRSVLGSLFHARFWRRRSVNEF